MEPAGAVPETRKPIALPTNGNAWAAPRFFAPLLLSLEKGPAERHGRDRGRWLGFGQKTFVACRETQPAPLARLGVTSSIVFGLED
jgi:hypothetical protein